MGIKSLFQKAVSLFKRLIKGIYNRTLTEYTIVYLYPAIYRKYSKLPVDENKVIFVEPRFEKLSDSFHILYDKLYADTDFELKCHFLRNGYVSKTEYIKCCKELIKDMATSKYVFFSEATHITGRFKTRPETVITQLWHGCGAFKKFGYSVRSGSFGASDKVLERYPTNKNYTHVTVSSPEVIWAYEEAMRYTKESGVVKALGCSRTDIFFDEAFISSSYNSLYDKFPAAKGKKVILYAPTFRGNVENAQAPDVLDLKKLSQALSEKYVIIIKHHPLTKNRPEIPENLSGVFAVDFTDTMSIEELLCVSDICISDYSSLIFEYSLFERPMIFLAYDIDEYYDSRGFYYDYKEMTPGPVVSSTKEIIEYVSDIDRRFDKKLVTDFRNKFMSSCDGNATKRIIQTVFGKKYSENLKENPLPKDCYHLIPKSKPHNT